MTIRFVDQEITRVIPKTDVELMEIVARSCYDGRKFKEAVENGYSLKFSDYDFLRDLLRRRHMSVFEFANIVCNVREYVYLYNPKFLEISGSFSPEECRTRKVLISGNLRAWIDAFEKFRDSFDRGENLERTEMLYLMKEFVSEYPFLDVLFPDGYFGGVDDGGGSIVCRELSGLPTYPDNMRRYVFHIQTNRSTTHQIVRHRSLSPMQESQRYVRYDSEITFIKPYFDICKKCLKANLNLIHQMYKQCYSKTGVAEHSRIYLPNITKSGLFICGTKRDILDFCRKRMPPIKSEFYIGELATGMFNALQR